MPNIGLLGAGGQAKETAAYCGQAGMKVIFMAVDERYLTTPKRALVMSLEDAHEHYRGTPVITAVGSPNTRRELVKAWAGGFATIISPRAYVADSAKIGGGTTVGALAAISEDVTIGRHVLVNMSVSVSHDCVVGDYAVLCPGVRVAGNVNIGAGVFVGIGAVISDHIRIGDGAAIAAGAVVVNDVPSGTLVAGVPAKAQRKLTGWFVI